jgi:hypothetical protein
MLQGPLNVALQVLVILGGALVTFVTAVATWRGYVRSISESIVDKLKLLQLPDHKTRIGYQNEVCSVLCCVYVYASCVSLRGGGAQDLRVETNFD